MKISPLHNSRTLLTTFPSKISSTSLTSDNSTDTMVASLLLLAQKELTGPSLRNLSQFQPKSLLEFKSITTTTLHSPLTAQTALVETTELPCPSTTELSISTMAPPRLPLLRPLLLEQLPPLLCDYHKRYDRFKSIY